LENLNSVLYFVIQVQKYKNHWQLTIHKLKLSLSNSDFTFRDIFFIFS